MKPLQTLEHRDTKKNIIWRRITEKLLIYVKIQGKNELFMRFFQEKSFSSSLLALVIDIFF